MNRIRHSLLGAGLVALLAACHQGPPPDGLTEGRLFPPVVLSDFEGRTVSIEHYRGKLVILNVWATWCPPCRKELPSLERLHASLDPERFVVIGMSIDSDADIAQEYLLERGITFKSYLDLNGKVATDLLGIRVYPDTFVISPAGVLLRRIVGERAWDDPALLDTFEAAWGGDVTGLQRM